MIVQSKSKIKEGPDVSPKEMDMGSDDDIEKIMNEIEELRQEMNASAPPQTRAPGKPPQSPPSVTREASRTRDGEGSAPASENAPVSPVASSLTPSPVSAVEDTEDVQDTEKVEDIAMAEDVAVGEDVGVAGSVSQHESIQNSPLKSPLERDGISNEVLDAIAKGHEDTISNEVLDAIANGREANRYEEFVKDIPEVSGEPPWFEETVAHLKKPSEDQRNSFSNSHDDFQGNSLSNSQDNSQDNLLTPASSLVMTVQGNMSFQLNYGNERQFVLIQFTQRAVKLRLSNGTELSFPISKKSA